jgi:hypothetical protein
MATVSTFDVTEHAPIERPPLADPGDAAAFPDVDNATAIGLLLIEAGEQAEADAIAAGLDAARLDGEGETAPAASVVHLLRTCELAELIGRHGDGK